MKICYASDWLPGYHKNWGGAEQTCYRLATLLVNQGHKISILATKPVNTPQENFSFHRLPTIEDYVPAGIGALLRQLKAAFVPIDPLAGLSSYRILRRIKPDVLHLHNISSLSLTLALSAKALKIPVILSVYDYWFLCPLGFLWKIKEYTSYDGEACTNYHSKQCYPCLRQFRKIAFWQKPLIYWALLFRKHIFDFFLNKIDRFAILSSANSGVLENYGIAKSRIHIVHIPLVDNQTSFETETGKGYILYVGWLHPRKGPHVVVEAMPQILKKSPGTKLYLIGEPANPAYLKRINDFIHDNGLEENVLLLGRKPYAEVKDLIRGANVLVIPEQWETIAPNALTEGLVYGKAIVASAMGGNKDFIKDGDNGLLANANDPSSFGDKITSIISNDSFRQRLAHQARVTGLQHFSLETVEHQLSELYQSVLNR